ncbi:integrase, catalytic region, zinc finger, CCHC-type containing protein [Tanacetum coccineum]
MEVILGNKGMLFVTTAKGEGHMSKHCTKPKRKTGMLLGLTDKVLLVHVSSKQMSNFYMKKTSNFADLGISRRSSHTDCQLPTMNAVLIKSMICMHMTSDCYELNTAKVIAIIPILSSRKDHNSAAVQIQTRAAQHDALIFNLDNSVSNQSAPNFDQYFELNELKAQSQEKDTVIRKLKERIKSLSGNMNEDKVKKDIEEIETINIELEHRVSKLIAENEHLKQTYKQLYDSIKPTRIRSKEQCDALVNQVNQKSMEISDLNVSLQEKDLVITALKNELRKLKGKDLADNVVTKNTIAPEMLKIDVEPIAPRLLNNRTAHSDYLRHTQEQAAILREIVEQGKSQNPLNNSLELHVVQIVLWNVTISRVYYVEGLGHNLFSVGQFYDSNLEVAFCQHTFFIHILEGVDLLTGSRGNNLYTLSLGDMMAFSPICLLSKASKTKSRIWSKDEAPDFIIKFLKMIQLRLKVLVRRIRTDNGTKFQNGIVERRTRTLIEAARTMLIYAKALLFLWAEAVATACYTQNRSIIRLRHGKTRYELLHDKLPDLSFFHVFGALCYPTSDSENLGKLQPKADIGIFIGYAPTKKAFQIYNRRTRRIIETIHVYFDELTAMASEHSILEPTLHEMTPATISSRLMPNPPPSTPFVPPSRTG